MVFKVFSSNFETTSFNAGHFTNVDSFLHGSIGSDGLGVSAGGAVGFDGLHGSALATQQAGAGVATVGLAGQFKAAYALVFVR